MATDLDGPRCRAESRRESESPVYGEIHGGRLALNCAERRPAGRASPAIIFYLKKVILRGSGSHAFKFQSLRFQDN
jgi:hypothetical protein